MFGYVTTLWPVIAGICLYAGVMHLQIGLRRPIDRVHTLFGALAALVGIGVFGNIWLATAQTPDQYQKAAWYSSITVPLVFAALPWFVSYYAGNATHRLAAALSAVFAVILIGNFFHPHSMLQSGPPVLQPVNLPWGEAVTRSVTPPTAWASTMQLGQALTIVYLAYICARVFVHGSRARAWGLLLSAGPFALSLFVNILVRYGALNAPYVAAPGFLAMVFVMSVALTREWRRSHEQMHAVLDNVPAVVYLKDLRGRYLLVNRRFAQLYGTSAGDVTGKTDADILDAAAAAAHAEADRQALASGKFETEEIVTRGGDTRTYASIRFALRDSDGRPYALCGIATDISERKAATDVLRDMSANLERRVARRTNELAQLNRELEAFAYSVSHDLRAPLTAVNGFAELLLREHGHKLDQNANRYLMRIRDASLRMAGLIQDLLGLSRVTQQTLQREPTDLAPLIEACVKSLREQEPARAVTLAIPTHLPAHGDPKLLGLALNNLLSNAWKYTSKTADPRIEVGSLAQNGETVYFVRDNGAGFNPDYSERLFRPFVRLHTENEFPGTGIGLATVARIVARHGGRVWAEGKVGQGATFYFTLPAPEEDDAAKAA